MKPSPTRIAGFTVLEMMIAIAVMGILIALAAPSFGTMLRNWKVRSMAESVQSGLQLARSEAIKRNGNVVFALVSGDPSTIANTTAPVYSATGANWAVFREDNSGGGTTFELIDSRINGEGSGTNGVSTTQTATTPGVPTTTPGRVLFNSFGRAAEIDPTANAVFAINAPGGACGTGDGQVRCLNVVVTPAGSIKMCDPAIDPASTDSRRCPN